MILPRAAFVFGAFLGLSQATWAAPHTEDAVVAPEMLRVTVHMLENGDKRSSQTMMMANKGSAENFTVRQNRRYTRNFMMAERGEGKNVKIRIHQCMGDATPEQVANPSSINCHPELMSRITIDAKLNQANLAEAVGVNGEKQEYLILVEKAEDPGQEAPAASDQETSSSASTAL